MNQLIVTPNKDILVSFIFTWSRQPDMSINEQRMILRVLEFCHEACNLNGVKIKDNLRQLKYNPTNVELIMPVSDAFFSDIKPDDAKAVLDGLSRRTFQFSVKDERGYEIWGSSGFIQNPRVHFGTGLMQFQIHNDIWAVYLNLAKGFRKFELNKALALPTGYAVRFYMLMSGKSGPLYMTVEDFKNWLGIGDDQYRDSKGKHRINNLEARVIRPSQNALDATCPYTFTYEKVRFNPRNAKSQVVGFRFYPKFQPQHRDPELEKSSLVAKVNASSFVGSHAYRYLKDNFGLTPEGLNNSTNKMLLEEWASLEHDMMGWLEMKKRYVVSGKVKGTPQAYIIGAIKRRVSELKRMSERQTQPAPECTQAEEQAAQPDQAQQPHGLDDIASIIAERFRAR